MNSRPPPTRPRKRLDAAAGPLVENFSLTVFLSFTWRLRLIRIPSPLPLPPFPTSFYLPICLAASPLPPLSFTVPHRRPFLFLVLLVPTSMNGILSSPVSPTRARARACTNTRIARIATSGTSACALSSLHDRVTPSSVALRTYVRTNIPMTTDRLRDHLRAHSNLLLP